MNFRTWAMSALAVSVLAACGGGGGGGLPTSSSVELIVPAKKGTLINANVAVFEIINGSPVRTTALATGRTGTDGIARLRMQPTSNPVLVEVTTHGTTIMVDETGSIGTDGNFPVITAPTGLTLRSIALSGNETQTVGANPFTEAGVAVAEDQGFTPVAIANGIQTARALVPAGVNPFVFTPSNLTGADTEQQLLLVALAGFAKIAEDCESDDPTGLACAQNRLNSAAQRFASNTSSTELEDFLAEKRTAALNLLMPTTLAEVARSVANSELSLPTDFVSPDELQSRNSLENFVLTLREGFRAAEDALRREGDSLNTRYTDIVLNGTERSIEAVGKVARNCDFAAGVFSCAGTEYGTWTSLGNGSFRLVNSKEGIRTTATVTGTFNGAGNVHTITYAGDSAPVSPENAANISETRLTLRATGIDASGELVGDTATLTVDTGTFRAFDREVFTDGPVATLTLSNVAIQPTRINVANDHWRATANGSLTFSTFKNDSLSGSFAIDLEDKARDANGWDYVARLNRLHVDLRAQSGIVNSNFVAFNLRASATPKEWANTAFGTYSLGFGFELTNKVKIDALATRTQQDSATGLVTITSDGSVARMNLLANASSGRYCLPGFPGDLCGNAITISSGNGAFNATLTGNESTAEIKDAGNRVVGVLTRTGVQVNGRELSFL